MRVRLSAGASLAGDVVAFVRGTNGAVMALVPLGVDPVSGTVTFETTTLGTFGVATYSGPLASVQFAQAQSTIQEGVGAHLIPVRMETLGGVGLGFELRLTPRRDGGALGLSDASLNPVVFPVGAANNSTANLQVDVVDDALIEGDESTDLSLFSGVVVVSGSAAKHTLTVEDDEFAQVSFATASSSARESASTGVGVMLATQPPGATLAFGVTVPVGIVGGTASFGGDYGFPGGFVVFGAGAADGTVLSVAVNGVADTNVEGNETVELALGAPANGVTLGAQTTHQLTLIDDAIPSLSFQSLTSSSAEGTPRAIAVELTIPGGQPLAGSLTVDVVDVGSGSAQGGVDYAAFSPVQLVFPAGSASGATQVVTLSPTGSDDLVEGDETVVLRVQSLSGPGALLSPLVHTVTILDTDAATLSYALGASATASETAPGSVSVVLNTTPSTATLAVAVGVEAFDVGTGSAAGGADYASFPTTPLGFGPGSGDGDTQTVSVTPLADDLVEGPETVLLGLQNPSGPVSLGTPSSHTLTLPDDDFAVLAFRGAASATVDEAAPLQVEVELTLAAGVSLAAPVTVDVLDAGGGSALSGIDYLSFPLQTLAFPVGSVGGALRSVTLTPTADALTEADETVNLALQNPGGAQASLGAQTTHVVTIPDSAVFVAFQTASSATANESGALGVVVELSVPGGASLGAPVTVDLVEAPGSTATSAVDFAAIGVQTLTFPAGTASGATRTVFVSLIQELLLEGPEVVNLRLENYSGPGGLGAQTTHALTITDDETPATVTLIPSFPIPFPTIVLMTTADESTPLMIPVRLDTLLPLANPVTVEVYDGGGGSATSGLDYQPLLVTVTFPAGSTDGTVQTAPFTPLDDDLVEQIWETVGFGLRNVTGPAGLGTRSGLINVRDSDRAWVTFQETAPSTVESTPLTLTVELNTNDPSATLSAAATVSVVDLLTGSASSGLDYTAIATDVTFALGAGDGATHTVSFSPLQDSAIEGNETVSLQLQTGSNLVSTLFDATATVTLTDDDVPTRIAYVSDQDVAGDDELFLVNVVGGIAGAPIQLNPALTAGGDVLAGEHASGISGDGRWLFYIADQNEDETFELFLVDLAGSAPYTVTRVSADLTGSNRDVLQATFAPNDERLVYLADQDTDGVTELYEVLLATPGAGRRISGPVLAPFFVQDLQSVHFSPGGEALTYVLNNGTDDSALNLIDFSVSYPYGVHWLSRLIAPNTGLNRLLSGRFTEGGDRVLWVGEGSQIGMDECYLVSLGGSLSTRVNTPLVGPGTNVTGVALSADGTKLAYWGDLTTDGDQEAYVVNLSAGVSPRSISPPKLHGGLREISRVAFNSSGTHVSLHQDAEVDDRVESYVVDITSVPGGLLTPVKTHSAIAASRSVETAGLPIFSPDGSRVLYAGDLGAVDDAVELYLPAIASAPADPSTSRVSQAGIATRGVSITLGAASEPVSPRFSADGSLLFYRSDVGAGDDDLQLYVRDLSQPSTPQRVNGSLVVGGDVDATAIPLAGRAQVVYAAAEAVPSEEQLFLCTLVDPRDSSSFTYVQLNTTVAGTQVKRIRVWE
ncbi:MAG: PD40 domain-containing protein [Planctomycetes bacterium]|nr:PD40 domain-containing protein [Planctomycetota bacterium]